MSVSLEPYQIISYALTLGLFGWLLLATRRGAKYSRGLFISLGIWALGHLAGMGVQLDGSPLYGHILWQLPTHLPVLRYDQLVHMFGFGVSTYLMYQLIAHRLKPVSRFSLGLVVLMAGLGIGAMNEIVEFGISELVPNNSIGQYENTSLDLVADLLGGLIALGYAFNAKRK